MYIGNESHTYDSLGQSIFDLPWQPTLRESILLSLVTGLMTGLMMTALLGDKK